MTWRIRGGEDGGAGRPGRQFFLWEAFFECTFFSGGTKEFRLSLSKSLISTKGFVQKVSLNPQKSLKNLWTRTKGSWKKGVLGHQTKYMMTDKGSSNIYYLYMS